MANTKNILITGGTGLLGKGMSETLPDGMSLVSLHLRDYAVTDDKAEHIVCDINNPCQVEKLFDRYAFDTVIHAAGIANVDYVEQHYEESYHSNAEGTRTIAALCKKHDCHMIYVSTNAVFDGSSSDYSETDSPRPINKYGKIKLECEKIAADTTPHCTIMRPILMYGIPYPQGRTNPAFWIMGKLSKNEKIPLVNDVYENPLYYIQCGEAFWKAADKKPSGIIHVAGGETINRYKFGIRIAETFGFSTALLQEVDSSFFPSIAPRPKNTSMSTKRMQKELGVSPWSVKKGIEDMKRRLTAK